MMCLSTVVKEKDPESVIMEYVSRISIDGDKITLYRNAFEWNY